MLSVVCWLWSDEEYRWNRYFRYSAKHVNILKDMVARHLHVPHEFVCITDIPQGIRDDIRVVPLWKDLADKGGCYRRLKIFSKEIAPWFQDYVLSLDLDSVIVDDITPLVDRDEPFIMWQNVTTGCKYCGSMFMFEPGRFSYIWDEFCPDDMVYKVAPGVPRRGSWVHPYSQECGNTVGTDQAWISSLINDIPVWTRDDGVMSFKRDCIRRESKLRSTALLPDESRIVFFHGSVDPSQEELYKAHPWIPKHWREEDAPEEETAAGNEVQAEQPSVRNSVCSG